MKVLLFFLFLGIVSATDFSRFDFGSDIKYYASGLVTNAKEIEEQPQRSLFTYFAIDGPNHKFDWGLTESFYYLRRNAAYITVIGMPGECFSVPNWNFSRQVEGWSSLRHTLNAKMADTGGTKHRNAYGGLAHDMGTCCDVFGGTVYADQWGRIHEMHATQLFPAVALGYPIEKTKVNTRIVHTNFRPVRNSDFRLPPECSNPRLDFCQFFYRQFGFCNETTNIRIPMHL